MRTYPVRIIKLSIGLNHLTGGPRGWTMCARIWSWRSEGRFGAKLLANAVDGFFHHVFDDQYHCWNAYKRRNTKLLSH